MASSFEKFIIIPGQALIYPGGTRTPPRGTYLDVGVQQITQRSIGDLDSEAAKALLAQALEPSVGREASLTLAQQLAGNSDFMAAFIAAVNTRHASGQQA